MLAGSPQRTWPFTRTAPVTGSPLGRRGRGRDCGEVAGTWLAAGRRRGACSVPCVSREALPGERLGLVLGVRRQQVAPGRVTENGGQGPCVDLRQLKVRGWWKELPPRGRSGASLIPRIPMERGVLDLFPGAYQAPCQIAGGMRREGEPEGSRCVERDGRGGEEKMGRESNRSTGRTSRG